jgi:septal ring factor EnvC (AmiA/AmiB activator)
MSKEPTDAEFSAAMLEHERETAKHSIAELEKQRDEADAQVDGLINLSNRTYDELKATQRALAIVVRAALAEALNRPNQP